MGLEARSKADWYTFEELSLARQKIAAEAAGAQAADPAERSLVQTKLLNLESNLRTFEGLTLALDFTRRSLPTAGLEGIWSESEGDLNKGGRGARCRGTSVCRESTKSVRRKE